MKLISKATAAQCYKQWHYFGDKGFIQTWGFGAYYQNRILGAISFHQPSAPETVMGLLGTQCQDAIFEIGRLAMSPDAPRNSESHFIAIAIKLLRKAVEVKMVITYADTAQGHTGIIYKASGFQYLGLTTPKSDFWVNGKIQERGRTKGINGEWKPRSRKHLFIKDFRVVNGLKANIGGRLGSPHETLPTPNTPASIL